MPVAPVTPVPDRWEKHSLFYAVAQFIAHVATAQPVLLIVEDLHFADWTQVFGDERLTAALLDRLTHKAHILEFAGTESYRFRERMQREARA